MNYTFISHQKIFWKEVIKGWKKHNSLVHGAALAFYTIVALPTLILALIGIVGFAVSEEVARENLLLTVESWAGDKAQVALRNILEYATSPSENILRIIVGGILLFFTITGVFGHLQSTLNTIWNISIKEKAEWKRKVLNRLIGFGSFILIAGLFAASVLLTGIISKINTSTFLPVDNHYPIVVLTFLSNTVILILLFSFIFKVLPDAKMSFRDMIKGGMATTVLFLIGESILALYFRYSSLSSSYGITGSLVILMLWIYYSAQILFIGAEITRVYTEQCGEGIKPDHYAEKIKTS